MMPGRVRRRPATRLRRGARRARAARRRPAARPWKAAPARLPRAGRAVAARPVARRPTTRGRGSSGAARSATSTSRRSSGPSWKPLPVLFTTPFSLFGDDAAPDLWLRRRARRRAARVRDGLPAGGAARRPAGGRDRRARAAARRRVHAQLLARQLRGPAGGAVPVGGRAPPRRAPRGRVPARLRRRAAAPEVWPFFGLYGLWLAWRRAAPAACSWSPARFAAHRRAVVRARVLGLGRRAAGRQPRAQPNPDSAAFADRPFLEVFHALVRRSSRVPVLLGARAVALVWPRGASGAGTCAARARGRRPC